MWENLSVDLLATRIVIVGVPVKNSMLKTNTRWNKFYYPTPRRERRAADDGDTTVAAIGVVRNERGRSLSREDQGGCRQVP